MLSPTISAFSGLLSSATESELALRCANAAGGRHLVDVASWTIALMVDQSVAGMAFLAVEVNS